MQRRDDESTFGWLLDRVANAGQGDERVSLGEIIDSLGERAFWPVVLLAGLITVLPLIGDIPGVPSVMAILVLVCGIQRLAGRKHYWLPGWLLRRGIGRARLERATAACRRPLEFAGRLLRPRFKVLITGPGEWAVVILCLCVALLLFPMEFIPFSANLAGSALILFALAMLARDGLLAIFAVVITVGTLWLIGGTLVGWISGWLAG